MAQSAEVLTPADTTAKSASAALTAPSELCVLAVGDYLYKEAQPRTHVYRVEKGVLAVFERRIDRPANIIEMAGRGDYVGLGCLQQHRDNARAVVDSIVSFVPRAEFDRLAEGDLKVRQKQDKAIQRDFEFGKMLARDRGRSAPVECVAAFLTAVSRQNAHEGRDPTVLTDTLKSGIVTSLLDVDEKTLTHALVELQGMGLVEQHPIADLHLKDIAALERVADGVLQSTQGAFEEQDANAVFGARPNSARWLPALRHSAAHSEASNPSSWQGELRESVWLVSVIVGLSVVGVGLAVMFAATLL